MDFYAATLSILVFCLASGTQHLVILQNTYCLFVVVVSKLKVYFENHFYSREIAQGVEIDLYLLSVMTKLVLSTRNQRI